jgi:hypothetical protein
VTHNLCRPSQYLVHPVFTLDLSDVALPNLQVRDAVGGDPARA